MLKFSVFAPMLLILACAAPAAPTPSASEPTGPSGTLEVGVASDIISGDFHLAVGGGNWPLTSFVPEGLVGTSPITGQQVPRLATSWKYLENGKVWEFKLRQGIEFHNGEPFNAESVKYSFDRLVDPATKAGFRAVIAPYYDKTEIVDDYTIRFVLKEPNTNIPEAFGNQPLFPPKYTKEVGADQFAKQPVGTGPYKFVERRPGEVIVLEAFEKYWNTDQQIGSTPSKFKTVRQRVIPEDQTRLAALQTKEVGLIVNVPEASIKRLESVQGIKITYKSAGSLNYILINSMAETDPKTGKPNPLRDRKVRQALNYAVDIDTIIKKLRTGKETRSSGQISAQPGFDPTRKPYAYDPAKAKALLAEAGYPSGFETTIYNPTGRWPASQEVSETIAGYLTAVGVKTNVQPQEYAVVAQTLVDKKLYGMSFWGGGWGPSAVGTIDLFFRAGAKARRGEYMGSPEMDSLIDQFVKEFDQEKQAALMKQMTRLYFEDAADIFLYDQFYVFAYDSEMVQWDPNSPAFSSGSGQAQYTELVPVKR